MKFFSSDFSAAGRATPTAVPTTQARRRLYSQFRAMAGPRLVGKVLGVTVMFILILSRHEQHVQAFVQARTRLVAPAISRTTIYCASSDLGGIGVRRDAGQSRVSRCQASVAGGAAAIGSEVSAVGDGESVRVAKIEGFTDKVSKVEYSAHVTERIIYVSSVLYVQMSSDVASHCCCVPRQHDRQITDYPIIVVPMRGTTGRSRVAGYSA